MQYENLNLENPVGNIDFLLLAVSSFLVRIAAPCPTAYFHRARGLELTDPVLGAAHR